MNDVLMQLFVQGPTWDGNLISKSQRDELVDDDLCDRWDGWNYLTRTGVIHAYKMGMKAPKGSAWYKKATMQ